MMKSMRKMLHYFSEEAGRQRREKAMMDFLSQAHDRVHLEELERQWFKQHGRR